MTSFVCNLKPRNRYKQDIVHHGRLSSFRVSTAAGIRQSADGYSAVAQHAARLLCSFLHRGAFRCLLRQMSRYLQVQIPIFAALLFHSHVLMVSLLPISCGVFCRWISQHCLRVNLGHLQLLHKCKGKTFGEFYAVTNVANPEYISSN